jgi:hypothetical protein
MDESMLRRQRIDDTSATKLFDVKGNSSIGMLPRAEVVVRQDVMTLTSAKQVNEFAIGAPVRTQPIPTSIMVRGLKEYDARHKDMVRKGLLEKRTDGASQAPKEVVTGGVMPTHVGPASTFASTDASGVQNPTARIV